ncbi:regulatory protein RecX [Clostridia bacterium]|nr:regulatory protein RecX [Clostridia bacterium]
MRTALQYLQQRARTEREMRSKLESKGFDAEVVSYILSRLYATDLLDDARFAAEWVQARSHKALGARRIRQELRAKGVPDDVADNALSALLEVDGFDATDTDGMDAAVNTSRSSAVAYAQRGLRRLNGQPDDVVKRKLTESLVRRGYSFSDARAAVLTAINPADRE